MIISSIRFPDFNDAGPERSPSEVTGNMVIPFFCRTFSSNLHPGTTMIFFGRLLFDLNFINSVI